MTRWKACAIHLALSALVLSLIALVLVWRWYPPGLFHMARADGLLLLIGGVDLVLGPLLTLIVFKTGKKSLKFDLTVIALLQVAALAFGLHAVWKSRPVFLVASDTRLTLVYAFEIEPQDLARAPAQYRPLPALGAETVAITMPDGIGDTFRGMTGEDHRRMPAKYHPYSDVAASLRRHATPVDVLLAQLAPAERDALAARARRTGRPFESLGAVPIQSIRGEALMLLDLGSGDLLQPVAVRMPPRKTAVPKSSHPVEKAPPARRLLQT